MPQVKGPMADPIIGLSYTVHDPDDWEVTYCFTESQLLFHKSVQEPAAQIILIIVLFFIIFIIYSF